ncbi:MAG: acetylxylan esterase [Bacteroidales bacterium]|nr:acetylxylan esterase [Bacteroidales bacterium]
MNKLFLLFFLIILFSGCENSIILPPQPAPPTRQYPSGRYSATITAEWITDDENPPSLTVMLKNEDNDTITEHLKLVVETDMKDSYTAVSDSLTVPFNETAQKTLSFQAEPGFYNCTLMVEDSVVFKKTIGHAPTKIKAVTDYQDDFDQFWTSTTAEVNAATINYKLTPIDSLNTKLHRIYRIDFESTPDQSSDGKPVVVGGYLSIPTTGGKHPAILNTQGLGTGGEKPWPTDIEGFCRFELYARGQFFYLNNTYGDWITFGLQKKETYYYKQAVSDVLMALRCLKSMEFVDTDNIFACGGSQGGALSIAAAAFDHSVNSIAVTIPFLGDYPNSAKIANWPTQYLIDTGTELGLTQSETLKLLSYFDSKNWATKVTCPILFEFSLQDPICPPRTTMAIYNNLINTPEKSYNYNPLNGHSGSEHFQADYETFFRKHLR